MPNHDHRDVVRPAAVERGQDQVVDGLLGGQVGVFLNTIYEHWLFQIFIFFCVLFHAINGLRITALDLFPKLLDYSRDVLWVELAVFIPLFALSVFVIMSTALGG